MSEEGIDCAKDVSPGFVFATWRKQHSRKIAKEVGDSGDSRSSNRKR